MLKSAWEQYGPSVQTLCWWRRCARIRHGHATQVILQYLYVLCSCVSMFRLAGSSDMNAHLYIYMAYVSCQRLTEQLVRFIVLISYRTISITMSKRTCNTPLTRPWLLGSVNESRAITTAISQNLLTHRSGNAISRCGRCSQSCASVANARRHRRSCVQCV